MKLTRRYRVILQDGEALSIDPMEWRSWAEAREVVKALYEGALWGPGVWRKVNEGCAVMRWPQTPGRLLVVFCYQRVEGGRAVRGAASRKAAGPASR